MLAIDNKIRINLRFLFFLKRAKKDSVSVEFSERQKRDFDFFLVVLRPLRVRTRFFFFLRLQTKHFNLLRKSFSLLLLQRFGRKKKEGSENLSFAYNTIFHDNGESGGREGNVFDLHSTRSSPHGKCPIKHEKESCVNLRVESASPEPN